MTFTQTCLWEAVQAHLKLTGDPPEVAPRYNLAPTQDAVIVRLDEGQRAPSVMRWGFIPSWTKDKDLGSLMFNVRSETVAEKPTYEDAFRCRRCLVPADGFYEWDQSNGVRQPYRIVPREEGVFAFAGVWERWERDGQAIDAFAILTTEANELLRPIHDRMPAILDSQEYDFWLSPESQEPKELAPLLRACPAEKMDAYPVARYVNRLTFDDPLCIRPIRGSRGGRWLNQTQSL